MNKETSKFLFEVCGNAGVDVELYENYSGRHSYGRVTDGIIVDSIEEVINALMEYMEYNVAGNKWFGSKPPELNAQTIRWDNMGRRIIVY